MNRRLASILACGLLAVLSAGSFSWPANAQSYYHRGSVPRWNGNEGCFPSAAGQTAQTPPVSSAPHYIPGHLSTNGESEVPQPTKQPQKGYSAPGFITTTTGNIDGYKITEYKGLVEGVAVRQPTWSQDAAAGMQENYGGSLDSYAQMCEEARQQAFGTLLERARQMGANAIVGIHFDSESFPMDKGKFATAVVCWGTAVIIKPEKPAISAR